MCDICFAERGDKAAVETGSYLMPKYDSDGLIVAVVTDFETNEVLMVGYMNGEALKRTLSTGEAWYWSRSRQAYWKKGETSGQVQTVREVRTDCDQDALVLKVTVGGNGGTCHVGYRSCFFRKVDKSVSGDVRLVRTEQEKVSASIRST
ncbi:phosphoribosyl-AMP cyclohydrolase [Roseibium hamelinense]|uniref:Phosphoribosyl-AMP cyclohydrolase n=1 Tax=Roseibium hamelinense TaxID=150831 RepID=A0A562TB68_9HYPH|nr:phosphoribosyl-AMP cyclohydrolase [Roseibium hamelinense]MTI42240.1 phosphoribosyl-AMP cyclohydrolase [Roseibium hamelinense]TWI90544.1 phosphoribosyl-AMP cyclohydrolase [Roseibium hamelinense]